MLPQIARLAPGASRRGRWILILCSLTLFALPTWFAEAQSQDVKPEPDDKGVGEQTSQKDVKSAASRVSTEPLLFRTPRQSPVTTSSGSAASVQTESSQIEFFPEPSEKEQHILSQLDMPTTFDFTDESLDGVRETIMERHGFDVVIEKNELEGESVATNATDLTLKVQEIPLRSALRLLLRLKHLAYIIEDNVLKITTETEYGNDRITLTYPVSDLTGDKPGDFQSLMEAIKQGVLPGSWRESPLAIPAANLVAPAAASSAGGGSTEPANTISMVPASGSLVIHQSWQGHDEVLKLLRALRKAKAQSPTR